MSHLTLKSFASPASLLAGLHVKPRPIDGGVGASGATDDIPPHAASKLPEITRWIRRGWAGSSGGPEVDISRAHLTHLEEMMLNLP